MWCSSAYVCTYVCVYYIYIDTYIHRHIYTSIYIFISICTLCRKDVRLFLPLVGMAKVSGQVIALPPAQKRCFLNLGVLFRSPYTTRNIVYLVYCFEVPDFSKLQKQSKFVPDN